MLAIDAQSSLPSERHSVRNPKPNPNFSFSPVNLQQTSASSNFDDVGGFSVGGGVRQQNYSRWGSAGSSRVRPRLVKMRKHLNGKSTGLSGASRGVLNGNVGCSKHDDVGFVFGVKQKQCNESEVKSTTEVGNVHSNGNDYKSKVDLERRDSVSDVYRNRIGPEPESQKDSNLNFEFGAANSKLRSSSNFKMGFSKSGREKPGSNNAGFSFNVRHDVFNGHSGGSCSGFVFGNNVHNSQSDLYNLEKEFGENSSGKGSTSSETLNHKGEDNPLKFRTDKSSNDSNDDGVFVFGSSSNGSSSFVKPLGPNCHDEVNPCETVRNCCSKENSQDCLGSGSSGKYEFPSFGNCSFKASASPVDAAFDLSNGINQLKIDDMKIEGWPRNKSSPANFGSSFAFQSKRKGSKDVTSHGGSQKCTSKTYGKIEIDGSVSSLNINCSNAANSSSGMFSSEFSTPQGGVRSPWCQAQGCSNEHFNMGDAPSSFAFCSINSKTNIGVESSTGSHNTVEDYSGYHFCTDGTKVPLAGLRIPNWDSSSLKESLFPGLNIKMESGVKSRWKKDKRSKSKGSKLKQPPEQKQYPGEGHIEDKISGQETPSSKGCYTPMDFSPYEENMTTSQISAEASATSFRFNKYDKIINHATLGTGLEEGRGLEENGNLSRERNVTSHFEQWSIGDNSEDRFTSGPKMSWPSVNIGHICSSNDVSVDSTENTDTLNNGSSPQVHFDFASCLGDTERREFCFSTSISVPNSVSTRKKVHRRKYRMKVPCRPFVPSPGVKDLGEFSAKRGDKCEVNVKVKKDSSSSSVLPQEACEKFRLRGNNAYKNGDLIKAEEFYTQGIDSVSCSQTSGSWLKPLIICHSNRAATRMSLGDLRKALSDCATAAALDPNFLKVQMRAGNCHLLLGEVELAMNYFNKCTESGLGVCLDRKITIEGADGLQKAQKVIKCVEKSSKLLELKTADAAARALDIVSGALSISPYSEKLLEMKAECMCLLRNFEEVILLCEKTLSAAEKNFASVDIKDKLNGTRSENLPFHKLWRWHLISKSHFYLGSLQVALEFLEKIEGMGSASDMCMNKLMESSISLSVSIRDLLHHKNAGNDSVRSGKYAEAVEHYTAAISRNVESRPFAAICFCNRAAAYQALGQIADAIADCSLAMALDANYPKAVSRRATLHEMIRDFGQTASDLQRFVALLEEEAKQSGSCGRSTSVTKEIRQTQKRLSMMEEESKKGISLDHYLILGVKKSETASDIKKAYRKAALRHHPDKVGQLLARSDSGSEGPMWKDIMQEVHKDADRLFKMIGEAYAVLSDTSKRSEYDIDEEIRKASKENVESSFYRRTSSTYNSPFKRNEYRRNCQDTWKTYGYSETRW